MKLKSMFKKKVKTYASDSSQRSAGLFLTDIFECGC